jgi:hypothetical protein
MRLGNAQPAQTLSTVQVIMAGLGLIGDSVSWSISTRMPGFCPGSSVG